jgi:hypothetical protein
MDWQAVIALALVVGYVVLKGLGVEVADLGVFVGLAVGWWFRDRLEEMVRRRLPPAED